MAFKALRTIPAIPLATLVCMGCLPAPLKYLPFRLWTCERFPRLTGFLASPALYPEQLSPAIAHLPSQSPNYVEGGKYFWFLTRPRNYLSNELSCQIPKGRMRDLNVYLPASLSQLTPVNVVQHYTGIRFYFISDSFLFLVLQIKRRVLHEAKVNC